MARSPLAGAALRGLHELRLFLVALQFLTRVPTPAWVGFHVSWLQACTRYFPLVGALVGAWGAWVLVVACMVWPPAVAVWISLAATIWLTGAFHEDGWADTCDGLGGTVSRERALEIMKDSRMGAYGGIGLVVMLGLKAAILTALVEPRASELQQYWDSHVHQVLLFWTAMGLIWTHAASRCAPVLLMTWLPYAGDVAYAKAKPLAMRSTRLNLGAALLVLACVAGGMGIWAAWQGWPLHTLVRCLAWSGAGMLLAVALCGRWFAKRLGGFTGDTLGACQQMSEVAGLLAWLAVVHPVMWLKG